MTTTLGELTQAEAVPTIEQRIANQLQLGEDKFVYDVESYNCVDYDTSGNWIGGHMVVTGKIIGQTLLFYYEVDDHERPFDEETLTALGKQALSKPAVYNTVCG